MHAVENADSAKTYFDSLWTIQEYGAACDPRGLKTYEVNGMTLCTNSVGYAYLRKVITREQFDAVAESVWSTLTGYSMKGSAGHSVYSERINIPLMHAINILQRDPSSRKAYVPIFLSSDLMREDLMPCITGASFMIRNGSLDCHVYRRSTDAYKGHPTDHLFFALLMQGVANTLQVLTGSLYEYSASYHLYNEDLLNVDFSEPRDLLPSYAGFVEGVPELSAKADAVKQKTGCPYDPQVWSLYNKIGDTK